MNFAAVSRELSPGEGLRLMRVAMQPEVTGWRVTHSGLLLLRSL